MEKKLYVITTAKRIPCLNNLTGPVTKPVELDPVDVLSLLDAKFEIYEVNPYNRKERERVTRQNFNSIKFKTTQLDMIKRKKLNREMQEIEKAESKASETSKEVKVEVKESKKDKKEETKKESDNKESTEGNVSKPQSISHTDFQKH